jgi:hypothetical protein
MPDQPCFLLSDFFVELIRAICSARRSGEHVLCDVVRPELFFEVRDILDMGYQLKGEGVELGRRGVCGRWS